MGRSEVVRPAYQDERPIQDLAILRKKQLEKQAKKMRKLSKKMRKLALKCSDPPMEEKLLELQMDNYQYKYELVRQVKKENERLKEFQIARDAELESEISEATFASNVEIKQLKLKNAEHVQTIRRLEEKLRKIKTLF